MKILIVQDHLRSGGTERQTVLLANAFAAAGHATTLLTFRPGGALEPTVYGGVSRVALQPFDTRLDWFAPGLSSFASRLSPDIILCMGRMANCYAGRLQRRVPASAVVATMRTGKPLPALFRRSLLHVRHVVANSRDAAILLAEKHGIPGERISVVHNSLVFPPVRDATGNRSDNTLRIEFGAGPATTVLLCVAMFRPEKNQRELIEIASELPEGLDWQLWLVGDGPDRSVCEQMTAARNLNSRVKFPGWQRDPMAFYPAADIAVHASWSESLSNFVIEAQAHGLPAVAYQAQGMAECFLPGDTGFVIQKGDRNAFRAAIAQLVREPSAGRSDRARDFARRNFDPTRQVEAYLALFEKLARSI